MIYLDVFQAIFITVLALIAYLICILLLLGIGDTKKMNKGEYNHLHGYQDSKEKIEQEFDKMAYETFQKLLNNHDMIAEAFGEICYEYEFIDKIMALMETDNYQAIGEELIKEIEKYLTEVADQITTDETQP